MGDDRGKLDHQSEIMNTRLTCKSAVQPLSILSLRAGGRAFPPANMNVPLATFNGK